MDDTLSAQGASKHVPVLLEATMEYLNPEKGGIFLDGTFGGGGHTRAMLESSPEVCVGRLIETQRRRRGRLL